MKKVYILLAVLLFLLMTPIVIWFVMKEKPIKIAIINQTVINNDTSDHNGLVWLINHLKFKDRFNAQEDFIGPKWEDGEIVSNDFPENFDDVDFIYLADSYGLDNDEGGLKKEHWDRIKTRLLSNEKSLFIGEFNNLAAPTTTEVREDFTAFLNMKWTGWNGKHVEDLRASSEEIPPAVLQDFEGEWDYEGSGFLLVNELENKLVILYDDTHVTKPGLTFELTDDGKKLADISRKPLYKGWFEIVEPENKNDELATLNFSLSDEGEKLLEENGIPTSFPAIIEQQTNSSSRYYFAGDYDNIEEPMTFYQLYGLASVNELAYRYGDTAFYWNIFVPIMKGIIEAFEEKEVVAMDHPAETYNARVTKDQFEVLVNDKWEKTTIKGVNLGMGKPGAFPGEAAITYEEYYRWMTQISEMNANVIRVYTLHPPAFYKALADFNEQAETPLYVMHGVWVEEEALEETLDAYTPELVEEFQSEMKRISDVIHGNAVIEQRPGHAYGVYEANISQYVISWIIGIEWYPYMVENMIEKYPNKEQFSGKYFETKEAHAFEIWLAEQMEYLFDYELSTYNSMRPMAFSNWVPTDNVEQPYEPLIQEDLVSVDPNKVYTKNEADKVGQFASYHVYPYYPDFLNVDPSLVNFIDHRGEKNSYAGYLKQLKDSHRLPILISEFGIPSSRGLTHESVHGYNQGFTDEVKQGEQVVHLYEDIMAQNMLGGLVFIWQDEWFKRTWNTMGYDNPDRRPFWSNVQTNEQRFGLVSFDPDKHYIDGKRNEGMMQIGENIYADIDEAYLYITVDNISDAQTVKLYLDTVPEQGLTSDGGIKFSQGVDFVVNIDRNEDNSRLLTNPTYQFYNYENGIYSANNLAEQSQIDESVFQNTYYIINRRMEFRNGHPSQAPTSYEAGKLLEGVTNPELSEYNSLADYHFGDSFVEIRIPWLLIQAKDPSKKEFMGNLKENLEAFVTVDEIYIGAALLNEQRQLISSSPLAVNNELPKLYVYSWDNWEQPNHNERLKKSYSIIQKFFEQIK